MNEKQNKKTKTSKVASQEVSDNKEVKSQETITSNSQTQTKEPKTDVNAKLSVEKDNKSVSEKGDVSSSSQSTITMFTFDVVESPSLSNNKEFSDTDSFSFVSPANALLTDTEHLIINEIEDLSGMPLLTYRRSAKVRIAAAPKAKILANPGLVFRQRGNVALANSLNVPGIFTIYKNLNIGGFIPHYSDRYVAYHTSMGTYDNGNTPTWNVSHQNQFVDNGVDRDTRNLFSSQLVSVMTRSTGAVTRSATGFQDDRLTRVDNNNLYLRSGGIAYNYVNDMVLPAVSGDEDTVQYLKSLKKTIDNLRRVSNSELLNGFFSLSNNPALFRSFIEPAIFLSTFLHIMTMSVNDAIENQFSVIDRLGVADPWVSHLMGMRPYERKQIKRNFKVIKEFLQSVPYNKVVVDHYMKYKDPLKMYDGDLTNYDNTLISPAFGIQIPLTANDTHSYDNDHHTPHTYNFSDLNVYNFDPQVNSGYVSSSRTLPVKVKLGSIFLWFLQQLNIPENITWSADVYLSISSCRFTTFMGAFIQGLYRDNFTQLLTYLQQNKILLSYLKDNGVFNDTIFDYSDIDLYSMDFRDVKRKEVRTVSLNDKVILPSLPQLAYTNNLINGWYYNNISYYNDIKTYKYSDEIKAVLGTTDRATLFSADRSGEHLQTQPNSVSTDWVIVFLKNASINPIFVQDKFEGVVYLGPHGEHSDRSSKELTITRGNNRSVSFNPTSSVTINPLLLVNNLHDFTNYRDRIIHVRNFTSDENNTMSTLGYGAQPNNNVYRSIVYNSNVPAHLLEKQLKQHSLLGRVLAKGFDYCSSVAVPDRVVYEIRIDLPQVFDYSDVEYQNIID